MNKDPFIYKWPERTKARRPSWKLILQAVLLTLAVGFGPDLITYLAGYEPDIYPYKLYFMLLTVPVILISSIVSYRKSPASEITISSLTIYEDVITVTRHVIAETGRRFYVEWKSLKIKAVKIDDDYRVIQIDARWKASAYKEKHGKVRRYVDSDSREHPQTFQLGTRQYYAAVEYMKENGYKIQQMTADEMEKAKPFLLKHYRW